MVIPWNLIDGNLTIAIENGHLEWVLPLKMVIFHSDVTVYQRVIDGRPLFLVNPRCCTSIAVSRQEWPARFWKHGQGQRAAQCRACLFWIKQGTYLWNIQKIIVYQIIVYNCISIHCWSLICSMVFQIIHMDNKSQTCSLKQQVRKHSFPQIQIDSLRQPRYGVPNDPRRPGA